MDLLQTLDLRPRPRIYHSSLMAVSSLLTEVVSASSHLLWKRRRHGSAEP